mmetsp:Transcript_24997/g.74253  ORF Transcript_24997/g.74253 Transcript_24997/m.74253 type:complete len:401 (-) Transcript_24997:7680-8882(-)
MADRLVHERHVVRTRGAKLGGGHFDVLKEALRDGDECLLRPREEPVDRRAIGQRRELAAPVAEVVADRRHADDEVQVRAHLVDEESPQALTRVVGQAGRLRFGADRVDEWVLVLVREQIRRAALREDVVEVDEAPLLEDLLVREQEDRRGGLGAHLCVERPQVVLEVVHPVGCRELHLEGLVPADEGGEARERLLARAADADQHGVSSRVVYDARDAAEVLHRHVEEDEVHLRKIVVVLGELRLEDAIHVVPVLERKVHLLIRLGDERGEQVRLGEQLLLLEVPEVVLRLLEQDLLELVEVSRRGHAVAVHAHRLVEPQPGHVHRLLVRRRVHVDEALEDARHGAQVPLVVELYGCRQEGVRHGDVDRAGGVDDARQRISHRGGEANLEVTAHDVDVDVA